jgi:amino acid transporter/mannitol/fructose-specific phosphotransferase system IIA component (Ntr-type)
MAGHQGMRKELRLRHVFAVATGATLSSGLFLLPGLAAQQAGPAMVLCYMIAAVPLVPAMLSIVELATAMPRAGGAYYFLDRSLGPLAGTIGGFGTWLALVLKTSFALMGIGAYSTLVFHDADPWHMRLIAAGFAVFFGLVNAFSAGKSGGFQTLLVFSLLTILAVFMGNGVGALELSHFEGFFDAGAQSILSTSGLVYISYVGVTNVASIAEEVVDPERTLPLGVFLSLGTAVLVYLVCTLVMVGVVPMDELAGDLTPMATAAEKLLGNVGLQVLTAGAFLAFFSVSNAGIMSSSRYPLAMGRDHLLPPAFRKLSKRGTPVFSITVTVGAMVFLLLALDPLQIAKLASSFQLLMFALLCLAVIVMRESGLKSYDPGYRSPFYPWLQLLGILAPFVLIAQMGLASTLFSLLLILAGALWYLRYASKHVDRHGAIYHVFARWGENRHENLDTELRSILKEKGLRSDDPFEEAVLAAVVLDVDEVEGFDALIELAAESLAEKLPTDAPTLVKGFTEGTQTGATPVAKGVALPHMRMEGIEHPYMVMVRTRREIRIVTGDVFGGSHTAERIHAVFFLISPEDDPSQHLRMLAQLASRIDRDDFLPNWLRARNDVQLKEVFLRDERYISLRLVPESPAWELADHAIRELDLPDGCLVAAVRREGSTIVPRGDRVLLAGDRLLVIGEAEAISELYDRFGEHAEAQV